MECPVCGKQYERKEYFDKSRNRWKMGPAASTCSRKCGQALRFGDRAAAFWERVDRTAGPEACWPWQGSRNNGGYGEVAWQGSVKKAHRVAYELSSEKFVKELDVLHRCDNRPCCNPAHLFQGTHDDNMKDMAAKGRSADKRGRSNGRAKLTEDDVRAIRVAYASGVSQTALAAYYDIHQTSVSDICRRTKWSHVD